MTDTASPGLRPGDVIHGFCRGAFPSKSWDCRTVEAVGPDWVVTRDAAGIVELCTDLAAAVDGLDDRTYCWLGCTGPEPAGN